MRASAWSNGSGTFGIRVGAPNRRKFFDQTWSSIEVEIEGKVYPFGLTSGFWHRCPEFRDRGTPVIREWLRKHHAVSWPNGRPPAVELLPLGSNRFRLVP